MKVGDLIQTRDHVLTPDGEPKSGIILEIITDDLEWMDERFVVYTNHEMILGSSYEWETCSLSDETL